MGEGWGSELGGAWLVYADLDFDDFDVMASCDCFDNRTVEFENGLCRSWARTN